MPSLLSRKRIPDLLLAGAGIAALIIIVTRYGMPFRMDDVLYMEWANHHSILDAFSPSSGEIFLSFRPVIAIVFWLLTHIAGTEHYWIWHLILAGSFFIAIAFTGLTARFVSERQSALAVSSIAYWIAFLPILNLLFWFSDMTYTLEMMFVAGAWYYGLQAIDDPKIKPWIFANIFGILAVLTKEPAIILIHVIWLGAIYLRWKKFKRGIKYMTSRDRMIWSAAYGIFALVTLGQYLLSNASKNRFFHITEVPHEKMMFFIADRIHYYSDTLASLPFALYMTLAIVGFVVSNLAKLPRRRAIYSAVYIVIAAVLFFVSKPLLVVFFLVVSFLLPIQGTHRAMRTTYTSLFALVGIINAVFLLLAIMLVKTQLAELSFLFSVIGAVGLSKLISVIAGQINASGNTALRTGAAVVISAMLIGAVVAMLPKLRSKEHLLLDVQTSRIHANDAIKWMAVHLPKDATVAVTAPSLFGFGDENEITSSDDEYKVYAQHTFPQGFVRSYFSVLGRNDLRLDYLEDSAVVTRTLDAYRQSGDHYVFLQTAMDVDRFHVPINGVQQLHGRDSLIIRFGSGFPCEIWQLRP